MILYPKVYLNSVKDITIDFLEENNIKGLILDVDNTLIDYYKNMPVGIIEWVDLMKKNNIKLYILSNTNKKEKVENVSNKLKIDYINFAKKPFKSGFLKVKEKMQLDNENIGVVGDQIMTDVIGANRCKMFSILVKPIDKKDIGITMIKRPLENLIIKSYLKKNNGGKNVYK